MGPRFVVVLGTAAVIAACSAHSTRTREMGTGGASLEAGGAGFSNAGQSNAGQPPTASGGSATLATGGSPGGRGGSTAEAGAGTAASDGGSSATADGGAAGAQMPEKCPDGACPAAACSPTVFQGSGDACSAYLWVWDGDACAQTTSCACASGQCERVHATAAECLEAHAECMPAAGLSPDPSCAPTVFGDTGDDCVEHAFSWDGNQCASAPHCGCASGECDRLYDDYRSCEAAHAACLPNECKVQDAHSGPEMCGTIFGYAFNGWDCRAISCRCVGDDCGDVSRTLEDCQSRFERCLARVPACVDARFPVTSSALGSEPVYPEYTFAVEGYPDLYDAASATVAVFADWTAAEWLGLEELPSEAVLCPFIDGLPLYSFPSPPCPSPRQLTLKVGDATFRLNINLHWQLLRNIAEPPAVEVRIVAHAAGSLALQIRDASSGLPVLMVVQSQSGTRTGESAWDFAPFTFAPGEELCLSAPGDCGWGFAPLDLEVSVAHITQTVEPLHVVGLDLDGAPYAVLHGYLFDRFAMGEHACSAPYSPRQSFALIAAKLGS